MDHHNQLRLAQLAARFALSHLKPNGVFVTKVLQGGEENDFCSMLEQLFKSVKRQKPAASRGESSEFFVIAKGLKVAADGSEQRPSPSSFSRQRSSSE